MKKFIIIIVLFVCLTLNASVQTSFASVSKTFFAKVESENVFFYSTPVDNVDYRMFEIPDSYFVLLSGDENESFYKASYEDVSGYVLKNEVTVMSGRPTNPYATKDFKVFIPYGAELKAYPSQTSSTISEILALTEMTNFYGNVTGEYISSYDSNMWHYCSYSVNNQTKNGYLFSKQTFLHQPINKNNEIFSVVEEVSFIEKVEPVDPTLNQTVIVLIVIACALPILVVLYLLIKNKTTRKILNKQGKIKLVKAPKKDYYEFNQDDI